MVPCPSYTDLLTHIIIINFWTIPGKHVLPNEQDIKVISEQLEELAELSLIENEDNLKEARQWYDREQIFKHSLSDIMEQASVLIPLGKDVQQNNVRW